MKKYILLLITAITFGQASNHMVSFTAAQSLGFSLNSGQSNVTSNQCMTKSEALAKYNLNASSMSSYASNQLVPRSVWVNALTYYTFNFIGGPGYSYGGSCGSTEDIIQLYSPDSVLDINSVIYTNTGLTTASDGGGLEYLNTDTDRGITWSSVGVVTAIYDCNLDITPPSTPTNLATSLLSSTEVLLNWTASTDDVAIFLYEVEMSTTSGTSGFTNIGNPTTNSFSVNGLTPSTNHWFRVRAKDTSNNLSSYSSVVNQYTFE
ncbi:fibronectin type III domain-containing protein [Flavobacterium sp. LB2P84]|uniref:fibronectin type III domain-containing protein n=1 Tax=Flavobacterium yafengii TaxID=3041253 RepID=UPI0024A917E6|nr:fibronectin type III domain-containing protein [Flavobacterium yafengii]MDI6034841.1 fibronectin type III domain-containing protein [Flavobacterium yafengii]